MEGGMSERGFRDGGMRERGVQGWGYEGTGGSGMGVRGNGGSGTILLFKALGVSVHSHSRRVSIHLALQPWTGGKTAFGSKAFTVHRGAMLRYSSSTPM
eukprot:352834-Chlamydomonas_euryale.AAC.19